MANGWRSATTPVPCKSAAFPTERSSARGETSRRDHRAGVQPGRQAPGSRRDRGQGLAKLADGRSVGSVRARQSRPLVAKRWSDSWTCSSRTLLHERMETPAAGLLPGIQPGRRPVDHGQHGQKSPGVCRRRRLGPARTTVRSPSPRATLSLASRPGRERSSADHVELSYGTAQADRTHRLGRNDREAGGTGCRSGDDPVTRHGSSPARGATGSRPLDITAPRYGRQRTQARSRVYFSDHTGYVEDLVPSPDGKTLLSVSWDQTARLWSMPDGKPLGSPLPHMGIVTRCAIASDNIHLATLAEGLVRVWRRSDADVAGIHPVNWHGIARPSFDGRLIAPGIWHEKAQGL